MNENGDIPETYFDDRITLGIELTVFDINESNYELGAKTVLCLLLKPVSYTHLTLPTKA